MNLLLAKKIVVSVIQVAVAVVEGIELIEKAKSMDVLESTDGKSK